MSSTVTSQDSHQSQKPGKSEAKNPVTIPARSCKRPRADKGKARCNKGKASGLLKNSFTGVPNSLWGFHGVSPLARLVYGFIASTPEYLPVDAAMIADAICEPQRKVLKCLKALLEFGMISSKRSWKTNLYQVKPADLWKVIPKIK